MIEVKYINESTVTIYKDSSFLGYLSIGVVEDYMRECDMI